MSSVVIPQPSTDTIFTDIAEAQKFINRVSALEIGYLSVSNTQMSSTSPGQIAQYSVLDINGVLFKENSNVNVSGSGGSGSYIYAAASGNSVTYTTDYTAPTWTPKNNGWYDSNGRRAIMRIGSYGKMILDSYVANQIDYMVGVDGR